MPFDNQNKLKDIREFFGTPERPVDASELVEFWESLTNEEKDEFRRSELR